MHVFKVKVLTQDGRVRTDVIRANDESEAIGRAREGRVLSCFWVGRA